MRVKCIVVLYCKYSTKAQSYSGAPKTRAINISTILELQTLFSSEIKGSTMSPNGGWLNINILMATKTLLSRYSILAHKYGSHAHARADAHARHEDLLLCLPSDVETCGDLPCASCSEEEKSQHYPAS
jgi:hypothetical protein